jgi:hypothetical protein
MVRVDRHRQRLPIEVLPPRRSAAIKVARQRACKHGRSPRAGLDRENDVVASTEPGNPQASSRDIYSPGRLPACAARPLRGRSEILVNEPGDVDQKNVDACTHRHLQ